MVECEGGSAFEEITGLPFYVSNDADLAGVAEMSLGAGKREKVWYCSLLLELELVRAYFIREN